MIIITLHPEPHLAKGPQTLRLEKIWKDWGQLYAKEVTMVVGPPPVFYMKKVIVREEAMSEKGELEAAENGMPRVVA